MKKKKKREKEKQTSVGTNLDKCVCPHWPLCTAKHREVHSCPFFSKK